jgi:hypothetical protein
MKFLDPEKGLANRLCSIEPITMALGAGALAQGAGGIFGGIFGSSAAKKQAEAIKHAANVARQTALELNERGWKEFGGYTDRFAAPIFNRGNQAGQSLMDMLTTGKLPYEVQASDLFRFESNLGQRDIKRQLKARGLYGSGAGLEALGRFETELVAKEGQRHYDRLFSGFTELSRQGLQAGNQAVAGATSMATSTSALGGSLADMQAQTGMAAAKARAEGTRSLAEIPQSILGAGANFAGGMMQYDLFKPMIDKMLGQSTGRPGAPSGVSVAVNPETAPLGLSNPQTNSLMGDFSFNRFFG